MQANANRGPTQANKKSAGCNTRIQRFLFSNIYRVQQAVEGGCAKDG